MEDQIRSFSDREVLLLQQLAQNVVVAIENATLYNQVRSMTATEERRWLAQEIHDGLAQLIGSLRLWSEEARISLEENDLGAAMKTIQRIETGARDAYTSLRDEMLGLRDSDFSKKDILEVISEYLNRFQRQWSIQTQLHLKESAKNLQPWPVSNAAEVQLLRILQEGLTNIRRHARASSVSVTIAIEEGLLKIQVEDDGVGFDMERPPEDRLGLRIMRERAAVVGGTISISSHVGVGTKLEIHLPLHASQNSQKGE
jgi:two-component system nitrate/nitrite sensor histidine kinase NarX